MIAPSPAFARYVGRAMQGRTALWRIFLGVLLIGVAWLTLTLATLLGGMAYTGDLAALAGRPVEGGWLVTEDFLGSPVGIAAMLSSFLGVWLGVWIAVRLLHGRALNSVLGAEGRISSGNLLRGFAVALIVSALSEAAFYLADPSIARSDVAFSAWLLWLVPLTILLLVQTSAEELVFRGYLMQSIAALFRHPIVWAGVPTILFTVLHWDSEAAPAMNAAMLVSIAAFALAATALVYRTGDLGAATGVHLGINFFSIMIVSRVTWLDGAALLAGRPMDTADWSLVDAIWLGIVSIATFAAILWLLLGPRSPLKVRTPVPRVGAEALPAD